MKKYKLFLARILDDKPETWKDIHHYMWNAVTYNNQTTDEKLPHIKKEYIRQTVFKELQADRELCLKYGVPISINAVGVIITKDKNKIQAYLDGEKRRALSILKNSKAIKETYNFMLHGGGYDND